MTQDPRLKRRLVSEAVQENLDVIQGVRRGAARKRGRRWIVAITALSILSGAVAVGLWRRPPAPPALVPSAQAALPGPSRLPSLEPRSPVLNSVPKVSQVSPQLFPLAVRRVILDAGHGGSTEGALSSSKLGERLREKDLALDIALRAKARLEAVGFEVVMTRELDTKLDLRERAEIANQRAGDVFLSVHLNWIEGRRGVETYYLGAADEPELQRLVAEENRESGYSMSDMRRLLDGVYGHLRGAESQVLAESVQRELHRALREVSPELRDRGVKTAPFVVLVETQMPAILAEVSDLADPREVALLRQAEYRERIAGALAAGVRRYAETVSSSTQKGDSG